MRVNELEFPIYPLRQYEKIFTGSKGAVLVVDKVGDFWVLDDTSIPGTFSERRLRLSFNLKDSKTLKLYKLSKSLHGWSELLHNYKRNKSKTYVDASGRMFKYKPSEYCKVTYHKIKKVEIIGRKILLSITDIGPKVPVSKLPPDDFNFAGIVHSQIGLVFFGYANQEFKSTVRKV
jgi:hypothetical protein